MRLATSAILVASLLGLAACARHFVVERGAVAEMKDPAWHVEREPIPAAAKTNE